MYGSDDIPEFEKDPFFRSPNNTSNNETREPENLEGKVETQVETDFNKQLDNASKILYFGFEPASVGLGNNGTQIVLGAIQNANPNSPDVFSQIYDNLNMSEETTTEVVEDIKKQRETALGGIDSDDLQEVFRNSIVGIQDILGEINESPEFSDVQDGARRTGTDVISFILKDEEKPSLSVFLSKVAEKKNRSEEEKIEEQISQLSEDSLSEVKELEKTKEAIEKEVEDISLSSEIEADLNEELKKVENEMNNIFGQKNLKPEDTAKIIEESLKKENLT